ncbi:hypothetical protein GCM10007338_19230 [Corynebacterium pelargi]|uniref:Uncharacterized protein n=1 Tax=Corynebacterium pelargi TaxID=1471400 RepID=A0A410W6T1_9CORY|nr:hypothetical protein CPELA_02150 [Corynebacterium pelargi]GGG80796.1 hypothetical protein GCM10007338_19230 [Corynebacterium pelargi]
MCKNDTVLRSKAFRRLLVFTVTLLFVVWIIDSAIAARAERSLAQDVEESAELEMSPGVYFGGTPYTQALISGKIKQVSVSVSDVDTPRLGLITTTTDAVDVQVDASQVFSGDIRGSRALLLTQTIGLDGVSVGKQLGIADLDISNPYDISPNGGTASEAQLRGTPKGQSKPVSVVADLRIEGPDFRLTPTKVLDRGDGSLSDEAIMDAMSWRIDTRLLPMRSQAGFVYVSGGTLYFQAQERNVTLRLRDFSPTNIG